MQLSPVFPARRKLQSAARLIMCHFPAHLPPVLVFTDPDRSADPVALARALPTGWGLVYRHFGAPEHNNMGHKLARIARQRKTILLIGADHRLARAIGAHGVHWPQSMKRVARRHHRAFAINTMSAHSVSDLHTPQPAGIDARILSAAFPSDSPSAPPAIGARRFRHASRLARIPVYGLGGISHENARKISQTAGISGVGQLRLHESIQFRI